jgi:hypothetical protein
MKLWNKLQFVGNKIDCAHCPHRFLYFLNVYSRVLEVSQFPLSFPYILVWGFVFAYGDLVLFGWYRKVCKTYPIHHHFQKLWVNWGCMLLEHWNTCMTTVLGWMHVSWLWLRFNFFTFFLLLLCRLWVGPYIWSGIHFRWSTPAAVKCVCVCVCMCMRVHVSVCMHACTVVILATSSDISKTN